MSNRHRKLTLRPCPGVVGLPAPDDPGLPGPVPHDRAAGASRWPTSQGLGLRARHFGVTDVGRRRRHNGDAFLADGKLGLFVVCDGVGGRAFGGVAACEATEAIWEWILRAKPRPSSATRDDGAVRSMRGLVRGAFRHASAAVHARASAEPGLKGMCTTASAVLIAHDFAVIGHVGDSRVYLARGDDVHQLTEDHTLRNMLIKRGLAKPDPARDRSPVTRLVGREADVEADIAVVPLAAGDRLLLCSDGLHGCLPDQDLLDLFELDLAEAGRAAVRQAHLRGGDDDITALFVDIVAA